MDAKGVVRYGGVTMRLLLLLSALFAAITGVAGPRAQAQPVAASAMVAAAAVADPGAVRSAARMAGAGWSSRPPRLAVLPRLVDAAFARRLYAERRRE